MMPIFAGNHMQGYLPLERFLDSSGVHPMETEIQVAAYDVSSARTLQWLAMSLTPGIGAG
jgi:hypothetical protein